MIFIRPPKVLGAALFFLFTFLLSLFGGVVDRGSAMSTPPATVQVGRVHTLQVLGSWI